MNQFLFENGKGNLRNEQGDQVHVLEMEVDEVEYPLEDVTNYDYYMDLKRPEKPAKNKQTEAQSSTKAGQITIESDNATNKTKRTCRI